MDDRYFEYDKDSEKMFRYQVRKRMIIGVLMCLAPILIIVMIVLVQNFMPGEVVTLLFFSSVAISIVGMVILVYYGQGSSLLYRSMDILRKLAPPEPVIVGKYAVLDKDPVFGLGQWGSNALFFVAFRESERSFEEKTKLPRLIWTWEYKHRIGAVKVAKKEDYYTIPIGDGTYRTGRGILYALLLERKGIVSYYRDFKSEELSPVIEELAREVSSLDTNSDFERDNEE